MARQSEVAAVARRLAGPLARERGVELVDVEVTGGGRDVRLRVVIDRPGGVTTEDCAWVSERLSAALDVEDPIAGRYLLEVSSPGLDRPLKTRADFERFAGHLVRIRTYAPVDGEKVIVGRLRGPVEAGVPVERAPGRVVTVPMHQIAGANLEVDIAADLRRSRRKGGPHGPGSPAGAKEGAE